MIIKIIFENKNLSFIIKSKSSGFLVSAVYAISVNPHFAARPEHGVLFCSMYNS